jgi:hypothetical protein
MKSVERDSSGKRRDRGTHTAPPSRQRQSRAAGAASARTTVDKETVKTPVVSGILQCQIRWSWLSRSGHHDRRTGGRESTFVYLTDPPSTELIGARGVVRHARAVSSRNLGCSENGVVGDGAGSSLCRSGRRTALPARAVPMSGCSDRRA